jgi:hypothetical protein
VNACVPPGPSDGCSFCWSRAPIAAIVQAIMVYVTIAGIVVGESTASRCNMRLVNVPLLAAHAGATPRPTNLAVTEPATLIQKCVDSKWQATTVPW